MQCPKCGSLKIDKRNYGKRAGATIGGMGGAAGGAATAVAGAAAGGKAGAAVGVIAGPLGAAAGASTSPVVTSGCAGGRSVLIERHMARSSPAAG